MKGKHTTKINGYLIDVTEEYHKKYRPEESRHTYLKKQEKNVEIVSLEGLAKDEIRGMDVIADPNVNVEDEVLNKLENERIWKILNSLPYEDYYIATEYFMKSKKERKTLTEIGKVLGVSHTAVRKRSKKLREFLAKIL